MKNTIYTAMLIVFATVFILEDVSQAQSMPLLTDPVKIRELEQMSNDLELSLPQREAIIEVYDRYIEDFARTRNGEIKDFEDAIASGAETFGFMSFNIPERAMVEELVRKAQRAMKAIHRSDNQFFEEVSGMLSEKQRIVLGRVQIARELEAYQLFITELLGSMNRGARAQMRTLYNRLDLDSNAEIDTALDLYDQRYLNDVKEGFGAVVETVSLLLDQIDELGVRDMDQQAMMMRFMSDENAIEDLKRRGDILLKPLVDQAYEISQLNWKTWKKIDAMLDEVNARKLQQWYFSRSFYDATRGGKKIEGFLDKALGMKELDEGQRILLNELQQSFRTKWAKKTEDHADLLEKSRKVQTIAIMSGDVVTEFAAKLDVLSKARKEYIDATEARINGILGKELVAMLKGESSSMESGEVLAMTSSSGSVRIAVGQTGELAEGSFESSEEDIVQMEGGGEQLTTLSGGAEIPEPIAPSFPERASLIFGLDKGGEMIIESVYDDYRQNYLIARKEISLTSSELQEDQSLSLGARMRKTREANNKAAARVAMLDLAFFDDLAAITALERQDLNLKMLENHRARQRTSAPDNPFDWNGRVGDTIDLVGLYVMSDISDELHDGLSDASIMSIRKTMQGYHNKVSNQHDAFVQATYDMNHIQDAMWVMDESTNDSSAGQMMQNRWRDSFASVRDSKRALLLMNQIVMDELLQEVPESDFWKIRMEFVKKAYPDVFKKGSDLTTMLQAAKAINGLDPVQQSRLEELASTYRYDFWNLCESMIGNHQSNASAEGGKNIMSKEDIHRQLELEKLRFERRELNDRLHMQLRMILNEEQIKEVPGLRPSATGRNEGVDAVTGPTPYSR
tara:strand:- start:490 stop:3051 length:2562 start_codon:yes stop_codon:yes gene_type:complete